MMLDWKSLIPPPEKEELGEVWGSENAATLPNHGDTFEVNLPHSPQVFGEVPQAFSMPSAFLGKLKPSNGAGFRPTSPASPTSPSKNQGGENKGEEIDAGAAGRASAFRAENEDSTACRHAINAAAVALVLAVCERTRADKEELATALEGLRNYPPAEQVRLWVRTCKELNINPWLVMHLPSHGIGAECTLCRHIELIHERLGNERRQFHWTCRNGYQIMEQGRHTERILIAPPDCQDWERWRPAS